MLAVSARSGSSTAHPLESSRHSRTHNAALISASFEGGLWIAMDHDRPGVPTRQPCQGREGLLFHVIIRPYTV